MLQYAQQSGHRVSIRREADRAASQLKKLKIAVWDRVKRLWIVGYPIGLPVGLPHDTSA